MEIAQHLVAELRRRWPLGRLASVRPDGAPHLVPIVFVEVAGLLWSPIDAKPKLERTPARVRNLRAEPRASLLLDAWERDWSRLWWLRLDVAVTVLDGEQLLTSEEYAEVRAALHSKYPQYGELPLFRAEPILLRMTPGHVASWCASPAALAALERSLREL